jgi:hypothetical protein
MIRSFFLWCKHVVYAVAVLAIIACLAEIGLRVYDSATAQVTRRDLYDRGLVCKSWFVHHTLKPSHAFIVKNPDTGERVRASINSLGLRGAEPAIPKPPGTFRVLCLGDDSTFASGMPEAETFCSRLQTELAGRLAPSVEVINAGVPDYCPLLSYLQFRHELLLLQPDLVVLNFDMSDVADDHLLRRQALMTRDGQPLSCAHPALELPRSCKSDREGLLLLPQFARQRLNCVLADRTLGESSRSIESPKCRYLWLTDEAPDWSVHINLALNPLKHLSDLTRSTGGRLIVAACPAPWQVSAQASTGGKVREEAGIAADACLKSRRPFEAIAEFCDAQQISFCDVSTTFAQAGRPERLFLNNAAAFSPEGHALYARELAGFVLRSVSGPDSRTQSPGSVEETTVQPVPRISTRWK